MYTVQVVLWLPGLQTVRVHFKKIHLPTHVRYFFEKKVIFIFSYFILILVWDVTCVDTLATSRALASSEAGAVADDAEYRKKLKYSHLDPTHAFIPVAVETLGAFGREAQSFLREVSHRIASSTGDPQSHQFLLQRVSVAVQRGNAASILSPSMAGREPNLS